MQQLEMPCIIISMKILLFWTHTWSNVSRMLLYKLVMFILWFSNLDCVDCNDKNAVVILS